MANAEQLEILKQSAKVWNKWREENPGVLVDLNQANLSGEELVALMPSILDRVFEGELR